MSKVVTNNTDWKFTFGKYKGETIKHVMEIEPSYIQWSMNNVPWFLNMLKQFSKEDRFAIQKRINEAKASADKHREAIMWLGSKCHENRSNFCGAMGFF